MNVHDYVRIKCRNVLKKHGVGVRNYKYYECKEGFVLKIKVDYDTFELQDFNRCEAIVKNEMDFIKAGIETEEGKAYVIANFIYKLKQIKTGENGQNGNGSIINDGSNKNNKRLPDMGQSHPCRGKK